MPALKDRLKRIQESRTGDTVKNVSGHSREKTILKGWSSCGFNVLKRNIITGAFLNDKINISSLLPVLIPDLQGDKIPAIEDFVFFDLETTGLYGGAAGTIAFLAAFGRIESNVKLRITQYLLLDYPGVNDFLENILKEFKNEDSVIVTYNGKCFDSQVLKTMCLMNRIKPPLYKHADILHPARRLWKNIIQDCSQASIETRILNLDRTGDIPGALAPEIWFDFLKTGETEKLIGICDHNKADITGLASILAAMIKISQNLFDTSIYNYDTERLAKFIYKYAYRQMKKGDYKEPLKLINKAIQAVPNGTILFHKLKRRKLRLEKIIFR